MLITQNLPEFTNALRNQEKMICNQKGEWRTVHDPVRERLRLKKKSECTPLQIFNKILSEVEISKLSFNASEERMHRQQRFYSDLTQAGKVLIERYGQSQFDEEKKLCNELQLSLIKMRYRIQPENNGLRVLTPAEVDANLIDQLQNRVEQWKSLDEKFEFTQPQNYSDRIRQICQYPEIAKYLLDPKNQKESTDYLNCALRDNFSLTVLNQYHYESKCLALNKMTERIGAIARELITVDQQNEADGSSSKVLNLLMENRKINLLDKSQKIHFSNGSVWTFPDLYFDFYNKFYPGLLEIFFNGVTPFNGHELGPEIIENSNVRSKTPKFASVNTTEPRWFEKTPVLDIRSRDYIEKRYSITIQPGKWVTVFEATRQDELDVDKAHGFSIFFQPIDENNYRVYSFGAFPLQFPRNTRERVHFVGNTVPGTVAFDPNYFYSKSQKVSKPFVVSEQVALALLREQGLAHHHGIIFNFPWENCIFFMHKIFNRVFARMNEPQQVPNYFKKKFLKMKPKGALLTIQNLFRNVTTELLPFLKIVLATIFRAKRYIIVYEEGKCVKKSVWNSPFFKELKINGPSAWHKRRKDDLIKKAQNPNHIEKYSGCVFNYGHTASATAPAA